jgi:cytochrome c oxidase subunit 2
MRLLRTRRAIHKRWWIPTLATLALVLSACSTESGPRNRQNALRPEGKYAEKIDNLFTPVFWVAVIVGIGVIAATIGFALRYRRRPGDDARPKQTHGSTPLEIGWTILPAVILLIVAVPTVSTIFDLDEEPKNPIEITVVAKQWWWQFDYPKTDAGKAVVTANEVHIPTGRDVLLTLDACDESLPGGQAQADGSTSPGCNVLHSFWVPALAGKRDVVPGKLNTMKIHADEPGVFLGQCAEYCGLSHANMRFRVIAESPSEYDAWLEAQREGPAVDLADSDVEDLFTTKFQCGDCHSVGDPSTSTYGPNLTHLADRTTFASGYYELTRPKLIEWLLDAPSLVPMQSEECRLGSPGSTHPDEPERQILCVGMPSFTNNTPNGDTKKYPDMTRSEAERLADFLLSLK